MTITKAQLDKAQEVIRDARMYVEKSDTPNLAKFAAFCRVIVPKSKLKGLTVEQAFALGVRAAGLYSRYQRAGKNELVDAILAVNSPKPGPRARSTAKPADTGTGNEGGDSSGS
jgi:hypothetical protein